MDKRMEWLDFAKGMAIFFVVLGHAVEVVWENADNNIVHIMIYSFHMPFFFMLSGMVFSDEKYSFFTKFFKKKFFRLIIPSYIFVFVPILIKQIMRLMNLVQSVPINKKSFVRTVLQFRVDKIANFWFLPTLFLALIIMWCVHRVFKSNIQRVIVSIFLSGIGAAYISIIAKPLPFSMDNAILVYVFMEIGYQVKDRLTKIKGRYNIIIAALALIWIVSAVTNYKYFGKKSISLAYVTLLNPVLFFVCAMSGSVLLVAICRKIKKNCRINYWGKNTLVIYLISGTIMGIFLKWLKGFDIKYNITRLLLCFILSVIVIEISSIFSVLIKRYFPYVLGMRKSNQNKRDYKELVKGE